LTFVFETLGTFRTFLPPADAPLPCRATAGAGVLLEARLSAAAALPAALLSAGVMVDARALPAGLAAAAAATDGRFGVAERAAADADTRAAGAESLLDEAFSLLTTGVESVAARGRAAPLLSAARFALGTAPAAIASDLRVGRGAAAAGLARLAVAGRALGLAGAAAAEADGRFGVFSRLLVATAASDADCGLLEALAGAARAAGAGFDREPCLLFAAAVTGRAPPGTLLRFGVFERFLAAAALAALVFLAAGAVGPAAAPALLESSAGSAEGSELYLRTGFFFFTETTRASSSAAAAGAAASKGGASGRGIERARAHVACVPAGRLHDDMRSTCVRGRRADKPHGSPVRKAECTLHTQSHLSRPSCSFDSVVKQMRQ
jgi:hypothetical protein